MQNQINNKAKDTLVIFGERFSGGYVNGLVKEAKKQGMFIIYSTVGRRQSDGRLTPLKKEALPPDTPLINIPLEAGFDMQESGTGQRPVDLCQKAGRDGWEHFRLDQEVLQSALNKAKQSFRHRVTQWVDELATLLPDKGDVVIAHTMAGGVPRSRVFMPILNRVLKGTGNRFFSSEVFWRSDLGNLCKKNFHEVTAETYRTLIELSTPLVCQLKKQGRKVFYTAYSYHGAKVLIGDQYQWQSYAPYLQGFAKLELENMSQQFKNQGINSCVFNVPEILTKSSAVFPGVEIPLYCLLKALQKNGGTQSSQFVSDVLHKMKEQALTTISQITEEYFISPVVKKQSLFDKWPQHNTAEHVQLMLDTSQKLADLHKNPLQSITPDLSQLVLDHSGQLMFQTLRQPHSGVQWIGHKEIAGNVI